MPLRHGTAHAHAHAHAHPLSAEPRLWSISPGKALPPLGLTFLLSCFWVFVLIMLSVRSTAKGGGGVGVKEAARKELREDDLSKNLEFLLLR